MADLAEEDFPGFLSLSNYRGLQYGPGFQPQNRGAESIALDGTLQKLRDPRLGSPFTFRVRPPATLVNALMGQGGAQTLSPYDPLLRQVFDEAMDNLLVVEERFVGGLATGQEVEDARAALLGGRPPASSGNLNIIETAQRANNNWNGVLRQQASLDARSFVAEGPTRGSSLTEPDDLIARNGHRFKPKDQNRGAANQAAVSDLDQALDVLVQLNKVLATPPLTLLINPEQLQVTYTKKQIYQDRNRYNYIFQSWGEEQVRLSVSGKSAGFVVGAANGAGDFRKTADSKLVPSKTDEPSGYQYASKWDSAAWQNLMGLFAFYRNNGYIYDNGGRPKSEAHLFIGNIEILYDQWVYVGNFENFTYQYAEEKQQGAIDFSFEFVASFVYDRAQAGPIDKWKAPTSSPGSAPNVKEALGDFYGNARYTQTLPAGEGGAPSTAILDPEVDPFQAFRRPEIAPGVPLSLGSTTRFPRVGV